MIEPVIFTSGFSLKGLRNEVNEDKAYFNEDEGVWCVCDGMGGHSRGDYASHAITSALSGLYCKAGLVCPETFKSTIFDLNAYLKKYAEDNSFSYVGAAFAALTIRNRTINYFWSGDVRIYLKRKERLILLTRDHTALRTSDKEMKSKYCLYNAIGLGEGFFIDHKSIEVDIGDKILICTDGLYKGMRNSEICRYIEKGRFDKTSIHRFKNTLDDDCTCIALTII